jgi:hypothetical protein
MKMMIPNPSFTLLIALVYFNLLLHYFWESIKNVEIMVKTDWLD